MEDWITQTLEELGYDIGGPSPTKYQLVLAKHRMDTFGSIEVEIARLKAALDHDHQVIEAATKSLLIARDGILNTKEISEYPAIKDMVTTLYGVAEHMLNRIPTSSIEIRRILRDVYGKDSWTEQQGERDSPVQ